MATPCFPLEVPSSLKISWPIPHKNQRYIKLDKKCTDSLVWRHQIFNNLPNLGLSWLCDLTSHHTYWYYWAQLSLPKTAAIRGISWTQDKTLLKSLSGCLRSLWRYLWSILNATSWTFLTSLSQSLAVKRTRSIMSTWTDMSLNMSPWWSSSMFLTSWKAARFVELISNMLSPFTPTIVLSLS